MKNGTARRLAYRLPGAIRVLAVVSLLIGLSVSYLDSQNTADRRMHLLHEAPAPIGLQVLNELPGPGPGAETAVSARGSSAADGDVFFAAHAETGRCLPFEG